MQLEIVEVRRGAETIVRLSGELDIATGNQVIDAIRRALRDGPSQLSIDLREVDFLDLTGVGALIRCRRMAVAKRCTFTLTAPSDEVVQLLDLVGLRAVFEIVAPL